MFFSGCICDKCGASIYWKRANNRPPYNKIELTILLRKEGWSVGKDKVLCNNCRR